MRAQIAVTMSTDLCDTTCSWCRSMVECSRHGRSEAEFARHRYPATSVMLDDGVAATVDSSECLVLGTMHRRAFIVRLRSQSRDHSLCLSIALLQMTVSRAFGRSICARSPPKSSRNLLANVRYVLCRRHASSTSVRRAVVRLSFEQIANSDASESRSSRKPAICCFRA